MAELTSLADDIAFADLANRFYKDDMTAQTSATPDVTHMAGASVGAGALLLALLTTDQPEHLKVIALVGAIVLFALTNICDTFLRKARNATEQHRIMAAAEPSVILAHAEAEE